MQIVALFCGLVRFGRTRVVAGRVVLQWVVGQVRVKLMVLTPLRGTHPAIENCPGKLASFEFGVSAFSCPHNYFGFD
jgi:hypothetical protein